MSEPKAYRRWAIYLISCLLFIFSQFYRSSIAVISPNLISELQLQTQHLGLVSAAFFYAFAFMQIPVGIYLDSIGPRIIMTGLSLVAAAGAAIFAYSETLSGLVAGRVLLGIGMACNLMGPLKLMTAWFTPYRFATLATIFFSLGTLGNIVAATPLVWLTTTLGWRTTFFLFAALNVLLVFIFFVIARDQPENIPESSSKKNTFIDHRIAWQGFGRLLVHRNYWLISLGTFCRYGIYAAIQALWAAPYLMQVVGLSQVMTGNVLLTMNIGLILGSPICGWLSDTLFRTRKGFIITGLGVMAVCLIVLGIVPQKVRLPLFFVLFFCFGFFSGSAQIMYAHIKELMPLKSAGAAMTGINFFTIMGVAFFLHGIGNGLKWFYPHSLVPSKAFQMVFLGFGICLVLTTIVYTRTQESRDTKRQRENRHPKIRLKETLKKWPSR